MHIAVITHYFAPEVGAPSARLYEMAKYWVDAGHSVTVITNIPNHPHGSAYMGYEGKKFMVESMGGIRVVRCRTYMTPNSGFLKKALSHLFFMFMAILQGKKQIKDVDAIIVSSPTLFSVVSAWWIGRGLKRPYIFEVRDLWPGIFIELGVLKNRLAIKILEAMELALYKRAAKVVTVTRSFSQDISGRGIDSRKIHFIPNGVDISFYKPAALDNQLIDELDLKGKFVVLYCGAHGISHGLNSIIDVAEKLREEKEIHFLFVGDGAEKEGVINYSKGKGLTNITFLPSHRKERIPSFYNSADVCLVPLRNVPLFKTFIPSKMFEIMGCARPIIASVEGESAAIMEKCKGGIVVPPEDHDKIADAILKLKNDPKLQDEMGKAGLDFVQENYNRKTLAEDYMKILKSLGA